MTTATPTDILSIWLFRHNALSTPTTCSLCPKCMYCKCLRLWTKRKNHDRMLTVLFTHLRTYHFRVYPMRWGLEIWNDPCDIATQFVAIRIVFVQIAEVHCYLQKEIVSVRNWQSTWPYRRHLNWPEHFRRPSRNCISCKHIQQLLQTMRNTGQYTRNPSFHWYQRHV